MFKIKAGTHFLLKVLKCLHIRNMWATLPRKCFSEVFSLEERIFLVLIVKILEKLENSKANRKQNSMCGKLREEKQITENVAPSEDSLNTEGRKAMIIKKLA